MSTLLDDVKQAAAMGLTYGKYKALTYAPAAPKECPQKKTRKRKRSFTDEEAFNLWQAGMTDAEIGASVGVSRAYIQRWRDTLELPSISKTHPDTKKYRLSTLEDGTYIVLNLEEF